MNKLIIIRGNSGSGKSTVAKALQRHFGLHTLMISQDNVSRDMILALEGEDQEALSLFIHLLYFGHENNKITIMDGIFRKEKYEVLLKLAKKLYGDNIYAYYFDLPFEETLRRHQTRWKKSEFGEEEMKRWWSERDFIGFISEKIITQELSKNEIVNLIISDIEKEQLKNSNY